MAIWLVVYASGQLLWPSYQAQAHLRLLNLTRYYHPEQAFELAQATLLQPRLARNSQIPRMSLEIRASQQGMFLITYAATPREALQACRKTLDIFLKQQADQGARLADSCQRNNQGQRLHLVEMLTSQEKKVSQLSPEETRRYLVSIIDHREMAYRHSAEQRTLEMQSPLWVVLDSPQLTGRVWRPGWFSVLAALFLSLAWWLGFFLYRRLVEVPEQPGRDPAVSAKHQPLDA
jgi:hypothetical protein